MFELTLGGVGVPCGAAGAVQVLLNSGGTDVDAGGNVTLPFATTGLTGSIGFVAHYVPSGGSGFAEGWSACSNLQITANSCANVVGAPCCSFTQGAYGNGNTVAMCTTSGCNPITGGLGFIPAVAAAGYDPFNGGLAPNATTIGVFGTRSVTLGDRDTLLSYLPHGTAPSVLTISGDNTYSLTNPIPETGFGGGTLASQTMTSGLNAFLSGKTVAGTTPFTIPAGYDSFTLPPAGTPVCTKRLEGSGYVCEAFFFPACVAGQTVGVVRAAANSHLAGGTNSVCTPLNSSNPASDLATALDKVNNMFDNCAVVIECPAGVTPGPFTCPM